MFTSRSSLWLLISPPTIHIHIQPLSSHLINPTIHTHTQHSLRAMIRMVRRGSRKVWWLIIHKKRSRKDLEADIDEILMTELATIDEDSDTYKQNNQAEKLQKRAKTGKKTEKEELGRVFNTRFSMKNSYALFLDRMTSTGSFGGVQAY
ncbi:hypothetical protein HanOQP8_Chr02g0044891 [Helianthus annuus]|nr:hypothetical protein HanOQP8_Chr02g0044891 [Helianthus annuus]